jgi:GH25 family lysozyme M1 (1,4-beta-N-acetylmuramidase)
MRDWFTDTGIATKVSSVSQLEPGDVIVTNSYGHVVLYIGSYGGKSHQVASHSAWGIFSYTYFGTPNEYWHITSSSGSVTLTLYVHEGSASGPLLSGARVTGSDGAGKSFDKTTDGGYVVITGSPGTWSFTASKSGYKTTTWDQSITATCEKHAFLEKEDVKVNGIDVSQYQHPDGADIDWSKVYDSGYRFAFVKATEGDSRPPVIINPYFEEDMNEGHYAGMLMGAYHFAHPEANNATDEARFFISVAKPYFKEGYLRPVLDIEVGGPELGKEKLSSWIHEWMNTVKDETGIEPILYVNSNYAKNYLDSSIAKYDLWIAHWRCDTGTPPDTGIWDSWDFWQYYSPDYCGENSVPGISGGVDLDLFNGDMSKLYTFVIAGGDHIPPSVDAFSVSPDSVTLGDSFTISYTVSDTGGSGLKQVELWWAIDVGGEPDWGTFPVDNPKQTTPLSGQSSYSGSFSDEPPETGIYWYGLHVVDNAGLWSVEPDPPGPKKVTVTESPSLMLTPPSYDFGSVEVGQCSSEYSFTLTNTGGGTATGSVSLTGTHASQFTVTQGGGSFSLGAGASKTIKVKFCPMSTGAKSASLYADGSNCNDDSSSLSGTGTQPPSIDLAPSSYDFGSVEVGQCSSEYSFTLTNTGGGTATGSVSLTGTHASQFTITQGDGSFSLGAGASKTIKVRFCPTSTGSKSATLFADGTNCNDDSSSLSGTGTPPERTITFYTDPTNGGTITFDGVTYSNGQSTTKTDGTYSVSANPASNYEFDHWSTTGGVSVANPYSHSTTATVSGDGSIKAWFKTKGVAITATRDISPQQVMNGSTFSVTVTITANQDIYAPILDEDPPTGWSVTPVQNDGATFKESEIKWLWTASLSEGDSKTVIYNVTVPSDTTPEDYVILGNVSAYGVEPIVVGGDSTITIITDWNPWDDDGIITDSEIQEAVYHWLTDTPKNGHLVTDEEIQALVYMWLTG